MEEKPNGTNPITRKEMIRHNKTGIPILSPGGFWWWHGKTLEWQPVSPLESAECSERLLEAMPDPKLWRDYSRWSCYAHDGLHPSESTNRRMAIFLAALKWQGIEEPTV
jgi:hypothetical protein